MNFLDGALDIVKKVLEPWVPNNLITEELSGIYGSNVLQEMGEIIKYYNIYNNGADFPVNAENYVPSQLKFKKIRTLIDKEARFMFSNPIDVKIIAKDVENLKDENISVMQDYVNEVLKKNHFNANLLKGAKDCFIGKRIAIICNFDEEYGITISFVPSLEFIYDTDDYGKLNKIVFFYSLNDNDEKINQRIRKKKYWLEGGLCHIYEGIFDGAGKLIKTLIEDKKTLFDYIPAVVILNDGLTEEKSGRSEVNALFYYEQSYSKLANRDIDAESKSMNPITYVRDMSSNSTGNLSLAPGALWDMQTDTTANEKMVGEAGILEPQLNYSEPLTNTLNRIRDSMYEEVDMPSVSTSDLQGIVSSGKTFKAIYWGLIVRCNEKMLAWKYELEMLIKCIIDGAYLYPDIAKGYLKGKNFNEIEYTIDINGNYAIPEDEESQKEMDLAEVSHKVRSIKSYMKKHQKLTDEEAEEELKQIAIERQIFEESYYPVENPMSGDLFQNTPNEEAE